MNNLSELAASNLVSMMGQIGFCLSNFNDSGDRANLDNLAKLAESYKNLSEAIAHLKTAELVEPEVVKIYVARLGLLIGHEGKS